MKFAFSIFLFIFLKTNATSYYVSNSGNDANSGLSSTSPWATISKVNAYKFSLGDTILFNRGDTWYGGLTIVQDGLFFGSFGMGKNPIITGFISVKSWTNLRNNIWESANEVSGLSSCNMVSVKGINTPMGRFPNTGYNTISAAVGSLNLVDPSLAGGVDWSGAQLIMRITRFAISKDSIYSHNRDTLKGNFSYPPQVGWGYFIQNALATLDTTNEWYYNPSTHRIYIYSSGIPTNVNVSSIDTLVKIIGSNITINGISLTGSNKITISSIGSQNTVSNCNINFSGSKAIYIGSASPYFTAIGDTIANSNDVALMNDTSENFNAINNVIHNAGVFAGMGSPLSISKITWLTTWSIRQGIRNCGAFANISGNKIDSIGYIPIFFYGDSVLIENNYIDSYCYIMDDGGGIYSYTEWPNRVWKIRNIVNNIILNGIGAQDGCKYNAGYTNQANGIYLDAANGDFNVIGNTVNNTNNGIFLNNSHEVNILSNTLFNNHNNIYVNNYDSAVAMTNVTFKKNIFILYPDSAFKFPDTRENIYWIFGRNLILSTSSLPATFVSDSNNYFNRTKNFLVIKGSFVSYMDLSEWQTYSGRDLNSALPASNLFLRSKPSFFYNGTGTESNTNLSGVHADISGKIYKDSIMIPAFQSKVLFSID